MQRIVNINRKLPTPYEEQTMEDAAPIPGHSGYMAAKSGEILSLKNGSPLTLKQSEAGSMGYKVVSLSDLGKRRNYYVHRLILETFVGPCPEGMVCRHINTNHHDNRLENLAWGTPKENGLDAISAGKTTRGERDSQAKLTAPEVVQIRKLVASGHSMNSLSRRFGVCPEQIRRIVKMENWRHVA